MHDTNPDTFTVEYTYSFDNPFLHAYTVSKRFAFAFGFTVGVAIGIAFIGAIAQYLA